VRSNHGVFPEKKRTLASPPNTLGTAALWERDCGDFTLKMNQKANIPRLASNTMFWPLRSHWS
jgi:hypothetical protein